MLRASRPGGNGSLLFAAAVLVLVLPGCGSRTPDEATLPPPTDQELAEMRAVSHRQGRGGGRWPKIEIPRFRHWGVKETAADALARIGAASVPSLVEALRDENPDVRAQAAWALARMGPEAREAVPSLAAALADEDDRVRQSAARALGQIGPDAAEAVGVLIQAMRDERRPASGRGAAVSAARR